LLSGRSGIVIKRPYPSNGVRLAHFFTLALQLRLPHPCVFRKGGAAIRQSTLKPLAAKDAKGELTVCEVSPLRPWFLGNFVVLSQSSRPLLALTCPRRPPKMSRRSRATSALTITHERFAHK
jgi:hypothetical protein